MYVYIRFIKNKTSVDTRQTATRIHEQKA